jgi:uncharacterized protein YjbJ (UPF0337 family)
LEVRRQPKSETYETIWLKLIEEGSESMGFGGVKGRAKEAAGRLTGNRNLELEGKVDQMADKVKRAIDRIKLTLTGRAGQGPR